MKNTLENELKEHHKDAYMWACQCCSYDMEEGKEVLQLTYLKIAEGKAVYREKSSFKTWLYSVIRFTAIDHLKKRPSHLEIEELHDMPVSENGSPQMDLGSLLAELSERQRQVLLLSFYHNMPLSEIARVTDMHIGTVRTHYERGKEALRKKLVKEKL